MGRTTMIGIKARMMSGLRIARTLFVGMLHILYHLVFNEITIGVTVFVLLAWGMVYFTITRPQDQKKAEEVERGARWEAHKKEEAETAVQTVDAYLVAKHDWSMLPKQLRDAVPQPKLPEVDYAAKREFEKREKAFQEYKPNFEAEPTPSLEKYKKRLAAHIVKNVWFYHGNPEEIDVAEWLLFDYREQAWLNQMCGRFMNEFSDFVKSYAHHDVLPDEIFSVEFRRLIGATQMQFVVNGATFEDVDESLKTVLEFGSEKIERTVWTGGSDKGFGVCYGTNKELPGLMMKRGRISVSLPLEWEVTKKQILSLQANAKMVRVHYYVSRPYHERDMIALEQPLLELLKKAGINAGAVKFRDQFNGSFAEFEIIPID